MSISEEQLAAFADGELEGAEHDAVAAAVAADPALAQKVAAHRRLRDTLGAHFAPILDQPVPERLRAAVTGQDDHEVVDILAARRERNAVQASGKGRKGLRWQWVAGPALAASLLVALFLPRGGGATYASGPLAQALNSQLVATQPADARTRILLSFREKGGDYCRVFSSAAKSGIACHTRRGWKLVRTMAGGEASGTQYRQAGSPDAKLLAEAQKMASGPALDGSAELQARKDGWQ